MLPELHAEQQLNAIEVVSIPHMTAASRQAAINRHVDRIRPRETRARSLFEVLNESARVVEVPKGVKR